MCSQAGGVHAEEEKVTLFASNRAAFAGRVVEYDNFYPEQCTMYAQHFFRVLNCDWHGGAAVYLVSAEVDVPGYH